MQAHPLNLVCTRVLEPVHPPHVHSRAVRKRLLSALDEDAVSIEPLREPLNAAAQGDATDYVAA